MWLSHVWEQNCLNVCPVVTDLPIAESAPFKVWVCWRLLAGTAGWNPDGSTDICLLWVLFVVCDRPIPRLEEFYRMYMCVYVCVCVSLSVVTCSNLNTCSEYVEAVRIRKKKKEENKERKKNNQSARIWYLWKLTCSSISICTRINLATSRLKSLCLCRL